MRMKYLFMLLIMLSLAVTLLSEVVPESKDADLVLINCNVMTMDDDSPSATAIAVKDGIIIAAGSNESVKRYTGSGTRTIDLKGKFVMPGLIESHAHFYGLGRSLMQLDLVGTKSLAEIAAKVKSEVDNTPAGEWIIGRGWDQNDWNVSVFPGHSILDKAAPDNPVYLRRIDGHALWVNSLAMKMAKIDKVTPDPKGGEIIRDKNGNPTGVLIDNAINLVSALISSPSEEEIKRAFKKAEEHCFSLGVTTFHDMSISSGYLRILENMYRAGDLKVRLYEMISVEHKLWKDEVAKGIRIGLYNGRLTIRGVKAFVDGALGSRGALLFDSYSDRPVTSGLLVTSEEELADIARISKRNGFQLSVHAIGDRGNHIVLNTYEKVIGADLDGKHRWRIEHAQILHPDDIPRFAKLGVIPSMQPTHCTSDMPWAVARLGSERIKGAYVWRSLIDSSVIIPGGSDAPVEYLNPLYGIYAAITRQDREGNPRKGWNPNERVTREEAFKMFTIWGAWVGFEENIKGKIKPGFMADIIVLDTNLKTSQPKEILSAKILMTFMGGEQVYNQPAE